MGYSSKIVFDFLNHKNIKNINGVLISNEKYNKNYDLENFDVIIISNSDVIQQGIDTIDGVNINYLICNLSKLRKILLDEISNHKFVNLPKVVESNIIYDKDGSNENFVEYFRKLYSTFGKCDIEQLKLLNNFINNLGKIIDTAYFDYIYLNVVEKIKTLYISLKDYKKSYDLIFDYDFSDLYNNCLTPNSQSEKYNNLQQLFYYCFGSIEIEILDNQITKKELNY